MNNNSIYGGSAGQQHALASQANQLNGGSNAVRAQGVVGYAPRAPMTTSDLITEAASRLEIVRGRVKTIQEQQTLLTRDLDAMQLEETRLVAIINTPGHERAEEVPQ